MGSIGASVRVLGADVDGFDSLEWAQLARIVVRGFLVNIYDVSEKQADNMLLIINDDAALLIGLQRDDGQWPDDSRLDEIAAAMQAVKTLERLAHERAGSGPVPDPASLILYGHGGESLEAERVA